VCEHMSKHYTKSLDRLVRSLLLTSAERAPGMALRSTRAADAKSWAFMLIVGNSCLCDVYGFDFDSESKI